jgi:hypothetical protein
VVLVTLRRAVLAFVLPSVFGWIFHAELASAFRILTHSHGAILGGTTAPKTAKLGAVLSCVRASRIAAWLTGRGMIFFQELQFSPLLAAFWGTRMLRLSAVAKSVSAYLACV